MVGSVSTRQADSPIVPILSQANLWNGPRIPGWQTLTQGLIVRTSPSQLLLLTLMIGAGVLFTVLQLEAITAWKPTVTVHLSMGLVAAGAFLAVVPPLSRIRRDDS